MTNAAVLGEHPAAISYIAAAGWERSLPGASGVRTRRALDVRRGDQFAARFSAPPPGGRRVCGGGAAPREQHAVVAGIGLWQRTRVVVEVGA